MVATDKLKYEVVTNRNEQLQKDGYHQTIMNIMYDYWKAQSQPMQYKEILEWFESKYGELAKFAVLIGKYNQQVTNGGHIQYFSNGYCDGTGSSFCDHDIKLPLHKNLIELLKRTKLTCDTVKKALDILERLEIEQDDDYEIDNRYLLQDLDEEYYEINEQFLNILEEYFKTKLNEDIPQRTHYLIIEKGKDLYKAHTCIDCEGDTILFTNLQEAQEYANEECLNGTVVEVRG